MGETFIATMKQLCIFTVLAQTLLHVCANKSFEKYIRLLVSCMSIIIIIMPILEFVSAVRGSDLVDFNVNEVMNQYEIEENTWDRNETVAYELESTFGEFDSSEISKVVIEPIRILENK